MEASGIFLVGVAMLCTYMYAVERYESVFQSSPLLVTDKKY